MAANPPLLSVIIIFLNAEKFLHEAVESVFAQTYQRWELILVDDGSTDRSSDIARKLTDEYPSKIRYVEHAGHQNLGMSASRNVGIESAKGEYIALLDSDDVWLPAKLEEQVTLFDLFPDAKLLYGNNLFWRSWNENRKEADYQFELGARVDRVFYPPEMFLLYLIPVKAATPAPSDMIFSREMAQKLGGFETVFRNMYEEQPFLVKVFTNEPVYVSSKCWTRHREHPDSYVAVWRKTNAGQSGAPSPLQWAEQYLRENGFVGSEAWEALQKALFRFRHPVIFQCLKRMRSLISR